MVSGSAEKSTVKERCQSFSGIPDTVNLNETHEQEKNTGAFFNLNLSPALDGNFELEGTMMVDYII